MTALRATLVAVSAATAMTLLSAPASVAADGDSEAPRFTRTLSIGDQGEYVAGLQERLAWMGYVIDRAEVRAQEFGATTRTAVRDFQRKFFLMESATATPRTRTVLLNKSGRVGKLPKPCLEGRVICIDMHQKLLRSVVDGQVRMTLDARFGIDATPTRQGIFQVYWKSRDHWSSAFNTPMPFALFFSGGQAIHFSKYFRADGYYGASHGCVNIRDREAAERLFDRSPVGTPVFVYDSRRG